MRAWRRKGYAPRISKVSTPSAPTRSKRLDTRERVLAGARRTFFERGYEGASMADIAECAGVSKGTLYAHFADKAALFAEVIRSECEAIRTRHFVFDPDVPLADALYQLGVGFLSAVLAEDARGIVRTLVGEAHRTPALGRIFMDAGPDQGAAALAALLDRAVDRGQLAIPDTRLAARQFIHLCDAGLSQDAHMGEPLPSHARIEAQVRGAVRLFLRGYAAD